MLNVGSIASFLRHRLKRPWGCLAALVAVYYLFRDPRAKKLLAKFLARHNSTSRGSSVRAANGLDAENREAPKHFRKAGFPSAAVDETFVREFREILRVVVPTLFCKEAAFLLLHSAALLSRTFLSIYVASLDGVLIRHIVRKDTTSLALQLIKWLVVAVPATFVNSLIRYLENKTALVFRTKLVDYAYKQYFANQTFYRLSHLDGRLANADQCLTEDISNFSAGVARLYSHLTKPSMDVVLMTISLWRLAAKRGADLRGRLLPILIAGVVVAVTSLLLRLLSPSFGRMAAEDARRQGHLRFVHSRIIANSEEIAFYGGHRAEHDVLSRAYRSVVNQKERIYRSRLWFVMLEQFLMKYLWSACGVIMVSLPIVLTENPLTQSGSRLDDEPDGGVSDRTELVTLARHLLTSGADAVERVLGSYKELLELAGYTRRVALMLAVVRDVSAGRLERPSGAIDALASRGVVVETCDYFSLENVPVVTPTGDVVVPSLTLRIERGDHTMITGPNGCGKSSLFRIISGLWPIRGGVLYKPPTTTMFYVPQKPYLPLGTLRDQIVYPHTLADVQASGVEDAALLNVLRTVRLEYLIDREGGFDAVREWSEVLSGGEKQRVGLARAFYHAPVFALLDECTSAVSADSEDAIYAAMKALGTTLLTITHRSSLRKHHHRILRFDGEGGWSLENLESPGGG